ncbi:DUF4959 domain-containing protein [Puteibacter caeruleilacunae]|nr:DUF4959 domain-containing protein [Puteibacter caeruleilacunae]
MDGNIKITDMKRTLFNILTLATVLLFSCDEEPIGQIPVDSAAPGAVSNISIKPIPGGAILNYDVPADEDLLYIQARYQTGEGIERIWKSSLFKNELLLNGFGDTNEKNVVVEAVDRSKNVSKPTSAKFNPLTPPVFSVFGSVTMTEDFGGVHVYWQNPTEAELSFTLLTENEDSELELVEKVYSSTDKGDFAVRGFENVERRFSIYVADRWDNLSDTLTGLYTPWFETELERSMWEPIVLPGDIPITAWGGGFHRLIDDKHGGGNYAHTAGGEGMPIPWTFDLGQKAKLSRFKSWQRDGGNYLYNHGNPRIFEIWGSNNPSEDGSWDSWTKLGSFESIKPSGLPVGTISNEDKEYATKGEEFIIPIDAPAVRYIRYVMIESWSNGDFFHLGEIKMFGQPVEE